MANERAIFLNRLSLDNPEYFLCSVCIKLHPWRVFPSPSSGRISKCCILSHDDKRYPWTLFSMSYLLWPRFNQYRLHFTHLQLVMRRFYHDPKYGISAQSLFYIEVSMRSCSEDVFLSRTQKTAASSSEKNIHSPMRTCLTSFQARICPAAPSLCLRIQSWSVVSRDNAAKLLNREDFVLGCGHVFFEKPSREGPIRSHVSAYLSGASKWEMLQMQHRVAHRSPRLWHSGSEYDFNQMDLFWAWHHASGSKVEVSRGD
jgi:hypothetical protein